MKLCLLCALFFVTINLIFCADDIVYQDIVPIMEIFESPDNFVVPQPDPIAVMDGEPFFLHPDELEQIFPMEAVPYNFDQIYEPALVDEEFQDEPVTEEAVEGSYEYAVDPVVEKPKKMRCVVVKP